MIGALVISIIVFLSMCIFEMIVEDNRLIAQESEDYSDECCDDVSGSCYHLPYGE